MKTLVGVRPKKNCSVYHHDKNRKINKRRNSRFVDTEQQQHDKYHHVFFSLRKTNFFYKQIKINLFLFFTHQYNK